MGADGELDSGDLRLLLALHTHRSVAQTAEMLGVDLSTVSEKLVGIRTALKVGSTAEALQKVTGTHDDTDARLDLT